jgi:ribosome biogenesis GTPase A/gas vesicle protein
MSDEHNENNEDSHEEPTEANESDSADAGEDKSAELGNRLRERIKKGSARAEKLEKLEKKGKATKKKGGDADDDGVKAPAAKGEGLSTENDDYVLEELASAGADRGAPEDPEIEDSGEADGEGMPIDRETRTSHDDDYDGGPNDGASVDADTSVEFGESPDSGRYSGLDEEDEDDDAEKAPEASEPAESDDGAGFEEIGPDDEDDDRNPDITLGSTDREEDDVSAPEDDRAQAADVHGATDDEDDVEAEDDADGAGVPNPDERILPVERDHVEDLLGELGEIAGGSGLKSLEKEVTEERIPALQQGQMSVVVLGEFNHGKSTVVNALLGEPILPTGITPTTAVITHLVYGEEPMAAVKAPRGGDKRVIEYDEMAEQIRRVEEEEGNEPDYVEIAYPNELLSDSLVLVDTPGVNDISQQKVEITYGYVPKADVVIYVLDATQVLKKSEVTFIRDRLLKANRDRIIFVLGKTDALSDEDVGEVESYARERLAELIGPVELFGFSARQALEAQERGDEPSDDFKEFKRYLLKFLRDHKAYILLDSALGGGLRIAGLLEQNLAIKKQGYLLEKEELDKRINKVKSKLKESRRLISENLEHIDERIGGIAATARHNLETFVEEFEEKLPQQIERAEAKDIKLYLSAWIQDAFKQWLEEEGERVAENLEELAEEVIEITNESMRETVATLREELGLQGQLDLDVDTMAYDVSVFSLGALGLSAFLFGAVIVGSILTAASPLLALFFKGKVDEKIKERAREEGLRAIEEASEQIEKELLDVIYDYGDRLKDFVENAGDRLYSQITEALAQVQREMDSKRDREELAREVEHRLDSTRRVAKHLESARERLEDAVDMDE